MIKRIIVGSKDSKMYAILVTEILKLAKNFDIHWPKKHTSVDTFIVQFPADT